jgi:glycosyltransferase involved in cell wall biosynthesis
MSDTNTTNKTKFKTLVIAPLMTRSGYGEHARFVVDSLMTDDRFDIYVNPIKWALTDWAFKGSNKVGMYEYLIDKYYRDTEKNYDFVIAVTTPPEYGPYFFNDDNIHGVSGQCFIGIMAGMEADKANPAFVEPCEKADKIIVPSQHAKESLDKMEQVFQTAFTEEAFAKSGIATPIDVVSYPVVLSKEENIQELELNLETKFNFLTVAQLGPRKNIEPLIKWFCEEFKNDDVGLVLKVNVANDTRKDFYATKNGLNLLVKNLAPEDRKCKVYMIHGNMTRDEMNSLYTHPEIHQFVTTTHGEGFGLPMFEAAYNGLPVCAPGWSGHMDFLTRDGNEYYDKIKYDLEPIHQDMIEMMPEMATAEMKWAYPREKSFKKVVRNAYTNHKYKKTRAQKLQTILIDDLSLHNQYKEMIDSIISCWGEKEDLVKWSNDQNTPRIYK